jgi:hypothetical protein
MAASWMAIAVAEQPARPAASQAPAKKLALVGGMLVTGYEMPPIHRAAIVIDGNKIVAAGPASEVKIPADAIVVDTAGGRCSGLIETIPPRRLGPRAATRGSQDRRPRCDGADEGDGDLAKRC